jgi:cell division protein ZipA
MDLDVQDWLIVIGALLIVGVLLDAYRRYRNERRNPIRMNKGRWFGPGDGFGGREVPETSNSELPNGGKVRVLVRDGDSPLEPERASNGRVEPSFDAVAPAPAPVPPRPPRGAVEPPVLQPERIEPRAAPRVAAAAPAEAQADAEQVVLIRVFARAEDGFAGADLLRIFRECDVRYGDMRIFHRHEEAKGQGAVQFSVVNAVEPGTFDPESMDGFHTRGLGFFMRLPGPHKPLEAFDCMLETARTVARYLDGELRDESNSVFTQQTGEHCRQRIKDFALRARARR